MGPQEFLDRYISSRTYAFMLFSETGEAPAFEFESGFTRLDDILAEDREAMCRGLYPVLMIRFDFVFETEVSAVEVEQFLLDHAREDFDFRFATAFVSESLCGQLFESLAGHCGRGQILKKTSDETEQYFCDCRPNESLVYIWIGLEPLPGVGASA